MKKISLLLVFLLINCIIHAQMSKVNLALFSSVRNNVTHAYLGGVKVYLLDAKKNVIDSTKTNYEKYWDGYQEQVNSYFAFNIEKAGIYYLNIRHSGYDEVTVKVDITKIYANERRRRIPDINLQKSFEKKLDGVVVTATKLKFYNKGDTLVYNADAFNLGEGSMLDALIRQLPGAELKNDGRIYVNGKFVESLMLNGKDFFRGNNKIMLDNLPTYMVNEVQVYNKLGELSERLGRDVGDSRYVMDVKLKKTYRIGWMGNVEAGAGTEHLWLARLFAMRFTDHSRLSVFGNINNVNDSRTPGQDTDWTPETMPSGRVVTKTAGLDYQINDRNNRFDMNGNVTFKHLDNNAETETNRTNFMSGGDTYDRILNITSYKNWDIKTNHRWKIKFDKAKFGSYIELRPRFNYTRFDNNGIYNSVTALSDKVLYNKEFLDSLYLPAYSGTLLNRSFQLSWDKGYETSGALDFSGMIYFKHNSLDNIYYDGWFAWHGAGKDEWSKKQINYLETDNVGKEVLNRHSKMQLGRGYDHKVSAMYYRNGTNLFGGNLFTGWGYGFRKRYERKSRDLYNLSQPDYNAKAEGDVKQVLPSETDYILSQDFGNSYNGRLYEDIHEFSFMMDWQKTFGNYRLWTRVNGGPFAIKRQTLKYQRALKDTIVKRTTFMPSIGWFFIRLFSKDNKENLEFQYKLTPQAADMFYRVNYRDDSDPLNIMNGNINLKDAYTHSFQLGYSKTEPARQIWFAPMLKFNYIRNAVAMSYMFNKKTGSRTYTPRNVNGNWDVSANLDFSTPVDKKKKLSFTNNTSALFIHNVDIIGVEGESSPVKSAVKTLNLTQMIKLDYRIGKNSLTAKASGSWLHSTSRLQSFKTINAYNYDYGVIANISLPWKFELSTDITMYSRRGYEDTAMNSDDLVWNARLSYPLMKGRLRLMIDGFDILHRLSNIQRYINAQGRTETRTNVVPRYVLFHVVYRLNITPKRK